MLIIYALLLGCLAAGFARAKTFKAWGTFKDIPVTIIICARNEEKHISLCLDTIVKQDYDPDKIQLLLVNDASSDATGQLAEKILEKSGLNYRLLHNVEQKGKKQSIVQAMRLAHHELVVLRDADTFTRSDKWLKSISEHYQSSPSDMIIAPVALSDNFGILWALQAIENNILVLLAGGSAYFEKPFLCNGANLAFTKKAFVNTGAYTSHLHIASGDDVLFMEDLKKVQGAAISYLKCAEATVYTFPCYSLGELIRQKTRWASKFKVNKNKLNMSLALLSFTVNLGWIICLAYGYLKPKDNSAAFLFVVFKLLIDFLLLLLASGFIKNRLLLWFSLPVGCVYPVYACVVALSSVFMKPVWKK